MSLDQGLLNRLTKLLGTLDDQSTPSPRLPGEAARLWNRLGQFVEMKLVSHGVDAPPMQLACYCLQLPARQVKAMFAGKLARANLRDRCEQSAELMVSLLGTEIDEALLDRAARLLHETPRRSPMLDEARLLADAINLDDFGLIGLIHQALQLGQQGQGAADLVAAMQRRDQYGYWEARLKDGFHFQPISQMAWKRLEQAREVTRLLADEMG